MLNHFKFLPLLVLIASLVACGSGSNTSTPPNLDPNQPNNYLHLETKDYEVTSKPFGGHMPYYVRNENVGDIVTDNQPESTKKDWAFFARHMGSNALSITYTPTLPTISTTGLDLPGQPVLGNGAGNYVRQTQNSFESYIDTTTFPAYDIRGAGPHTVLSIEVDEPAVGFGMKGTFKIPKIDIVGNGVHQLGFAAYLYNKKNPNQGAIGFVNIISESREEMNSFTPYIGNDTYTFFFSQPIKDNTFATRITPHINSHKPFSENKDFGFVFTKQNIQTVLNMMQQEIDKQPQNNNLQTIDQNPENYYVSLAGILHENFIFNNPSFVARSGYSVENLQLIRMK